MSLLSSPRRIGSILLCFALAACSQSQTNVAQDQIVQLDAGGEVARTVNGIEIPTQLVEAVARNRGLNMSIAEQREQAAKEATQYVLLAQQARQFDVAGQADLAAIVEASRLQGLANATVMAWSRKNPVTDVQVDAEYKKRIKAIGDKTYDFTRMLFVDKNLADKAAAELKAGTPFAEVFDKYRERARDAQPYTKVYLRQLPAEIAAALNELSPGDSTTEAVKSGLGWHLLYLDQTVPFTPPPFESVAGQIRASLESRQARDWVQTLLADAKISGADPVAAASVADQTEASTRGMARSPKVAESGQGSATPPAAATSSAE